MPYPQQQNQFHTRWDAVHIFQSRKHWFSEAEIDYGCSYCCWSGFTQLLTAPGWDRNTFKGRPTNEEHGIPRQQPLTNLHFTTLITFVIQGKKSILVNRTFKNLPNLQAHYSQSSCKTTTYISWVTYQALILMLTSRMKVAYSSNSPTFYLPLRGPAPRLHFISILLN